MAKDKKKKGSAVEEEVVAAPELYTTVEGEGVAEFEERKSVFIGHCARVTSEEEAGAYVKQLKKQYADARHNVWAYLLRGGIVARYSDDGEPQGTAGMPILDTIRKSGVVDAVVVVTRYFGGILLGAGGLVRAYSHGSKVALDAAGIVTYEKYSVLALECTYSDYQRYSVLLPQFNAIIDDTEFTDKVIITFAIKKPRVPELVLKITEMSGGRDELIEIGERFDYR